jgi:hypothetical protein
VYRLTSVSQSNAKGSWKNLNIAKVRDLDIKEDAGLLQRAADIYQSLNS